MAKIVSESLMVSAPNAPMDKRTEVNTISKVYSIENPNPGLIIFVKDEKQHYKIVGMKDEYIPGTTIMRKVISEVAPIGDGDVSYEELSDVDLDDIIDQEDVTYTDLGDAPEIDFESLS